MRHVAPASPPSLSSSPPPSSSRARGTPPPPALPPATSPRRQAVGHLQAGASLPPSSSSPFPLSLSLTSLFLCTGRAREPRHGSRGQARRRPLEAPPASLLRRGRHLQPRARPQAPRRPRLPCLRWPARRRTEPQPQPL